MHQQGVVWQRLGQAAIAIGMTLGAIGATASPARAAMALPAVPTISAAIQPVYWTYDRFGRRVWVERPYYRPPPPRYHHRRGWVDRYGRWHPYYR